jgi:hypothetical protein
MTIVMSSSLAGAEMMTFLAPPASTCLRASAALVKNPVDSMTTSTPRSPHGRAAGSRSVLLEDAQDAVVLEQVGEDLVAGEVVHRHDLDVLAAGGGGPPEVATDAAEAVDAYPDRHERPPRCVSWAARQGCGLARGNPIGRRRLRLPPP